MDETNTINLAIPFALPAACEEAAKRCEELAVAYDGKSATHHQFWTDLGAQLRARAARMTRTSARATQGQP